MNGAVEPGRVHAASDPGEGASPAPVLAPPLRQVGGVPPTGPRGAGEPVLRRADWTFPAPPVRRELVHALPAEPDPARPPLLFVHGAAMGAWAFDTWLTAAAEAGWRAYAVSLRGHGGSRRPPSLRRATLRHYEHDVLQTITSLPAPPVLIGHSLGALVVQGVLERYRSAPAGVLVCPAPPLHGLELAVALARNDPRALLDGVLGRQAVPAAATLFGDDVDPTVAAATIARMGEESLLAPLQAVLPRRARDVRAPVLVLGGELDRIVPPSAVARTARHFATRPHLYLGMGHLLMLEKAWRAPLERILGWLEEVAVRR